jgi:hypothetical protein
MSPPESSMAMPQPVRFEAVSGSGPVVAASPLAVDEMQGVPLRAACPGLDARVAGIHDAAQAACRLHALFLLDAALADGRTTGKPGYR